MDEPITTTYKGVRITYREINDVWDCEHSAKRYEHESLAKVKERIDAWAKAENMFERFTVIRIYRSTWNSMSFGQTLTVTSMTNEGDAWVTDGSNREKIDAKRIKEYLVKDTTGNRILLDAVKSKDATIAQLQREVERDLASMEHIQSEVAHG